MLPSFTQIGRRLHFAVSRSRRWCCTVRFVLKQLTSLIFDCSKILNIKMEKIIICLLLCCVALVASQNTTVAMNATTTVAPSRNVTTGPPASSTMVATTLPTKPETTPTSGVVSVKAFAGFVSFFALIALF